MTLAPRNTIQDRIEGLAADRVNSDEKVAELHLQIVKMQSTLDFMTTQQNELYDALMKPQPGQTQSLLARMASVTLDIEGGKRTAKMVLAIITFFAAFGAAMKFGIFTGVGK